MNFHDIIKKCQDCGTELQKEEIDYTLCVECYDMSNEEDEVEGMVFDDEY